MVVGAGENFGQPHDYVSEGVPSFGQSGEYVYREAIIYDQLEEDLTDYYTEQGKTGEELTALVAEGIEKAYKTELNAKAYVKVTPEGGEEVTIDAVPADTLRSMQGVALAALVEGGYEENSEEETALKSYLGGELTVNRETALAGYFDAESTGTLTSEVGDGSYTAYFGAKKVGSAVVAEGRETVVIDGLSGFDQMTVGEDYPVTLYNEESGTAFVRDFKYVSKVIDEASDLAYFKITNDVDGQGNASNVSGNFDGYYVLGKDIDAAGNTHTTGINGIAVANKVFIYNNFTDCGLTGTFDGNGHTISNLSIGSGGLFGVINEGTVKNLGLSDISFYSSDAAALAWYTYGGSIENVYIDVTELPNKWARAAVAGNVHSTTKVENLLVELGGTVSESALNGGYGSFTLHDGTFKNGDVVGSWNNVYIVSSTPCTVTSANKVIDGENTSASAKYAGIKRYESYDEMKLDENDFASFETSGYWSMEDGIPVFGAN